MMEHLNGPLEDVVVFGDDYNDLDMFSPEWFYHRYGERLPGSER